MEDVILLANISRPHRLIELSNAPQMASRTLAENSQLNDNDCKAYVSSHCPRHTRLFFRGRRRRCRPQFPEVNGGFLGERIAWLPCAESCASSFLA